MMNEDDFWADLKSRIREWRTEGTRDCGKDFNPTESDRPPREDGWIEETEEVCDRICNRGDQRIGQYVLNALATDGVTNAEEIENRLWNIEAPELLELLQRLDEEVRDMAGQTNEKGAEPQ
jgi:hypothetical protein